MSRGPKKDRWMTLLPANYVRKITPEAVQYLVTKKDMTEEAAIAYLEHELAHTEYWINDLYQVSLNRTITGYGKTIVLCIRRRDGRPIFRDWRHFQAIKNQLAGEEYEAIELYPAESRKVDTSNKYHLYCVVEPGFRFPLGYQDRDVIEDGDSIPGSGFRQRRGA